MKRSYPYTGPGSASSAQTSAVPAYNYPQPPPPAGPAPPLPAGPAPAGGAQTQAYANYGYGQTPAARSSNVHANSTVNIGASAAGLSASDAQQAQWHQQWQQYYAQQAAAASPTPQPSPSSQVQAGPHQPPGYAHGRVQPSSQAGPAQSYNSAYPQQSPQPAQQQPAYAYNPQQPQPHQPPSHHQQQPALPGPTTSYGNFQPPISQHHAQPHMQQPAQPSPMQPPAPGGYYANHAAVATQSVQGAPPQKRARYDQHQSNTPGYSPLGGSQLPSQGQPYYGSGSVGGASHLPNPAGVAGPPAGPVQQSYGWQGAVAMSGPASAMGAASPMQPSGGIGVGGGGGIGRGGTPSRGRGGGFAGAAATGPSHMGSPMSQGSAAGPPKFRGPVGRGSSNGVPAGPSSNALPLPGRGSADVSGWGQRGGRASGGPPGPAHANNRSAMHTAPAAAHAMPGGGGSGGGRRGGSAGSDRGGRNGGNAGRNGPAHGGRAGFSSQNSIPINAPHGPAGSRMARDAGSKHSSRSVAAALDSAASGGGRAPAGPGLDQKRGQGLGGKGVASNAEPSAGSTSKRSLYTDFRIRGIEIQALGWSWSFSDTLAASDPGTNKGGDEEQLGGDDDEEGASDAGKGAERDDESEADAVEDSTDRIDASSSKGDADEVSSTAKGGAATEQAETGIPVVKSERMPSPARSQSSASASNVEPPRGPRASARKRTLEAKAARARAAIAAATVGNPTKLRITFGSPLNTGPEGAPTGPKADKAKAAVAATGTATEPKRRANKQARKENQSEVAVASGEATRSTEIEGKSTAKVEDHSPEAVDGEAQSSSSANVGVEVGTGQDVAMAEETQEAEADAAVASTSTTEANEANADSQVGSVGQDTLAAVADVSTGTQSSGPSDEREGAQESLRTTEQPATNGDTSVPAKTSGWSPASKGPPSFSANRVTISYAGTRRRLVIDADAIKSLTVDRGAGRIEIVVRVVTCSLPAVTGSKKEKKLKLSEWVVCKGVLLESRGQGETVYTALTRQQIEKVWKAESGGSQQDRVSAPDAALVAESDGKAKEEQAGEPVSADAEQTAATETVAGAEEIPAAAKAAVTAVGPASAASADLGPSAEVPPLYRLLSTHGGPAQDRDHPASRSEEMTIVASLDQISPLVEAPWVQTGDIDTWLARLPGYSLRPQEQIWHGKLHVADPDPPPSVDDVLEEWCSESFLGSSRERKKFLTETYLSVYPSSVRGSEAEHKRDEVKEAQNRTRAKGLVELVARVVRGDRGQWLAPTALSGPLAHALRNASTSGHNHFSLSILAIFDMTLQYSAMAKVDSEQIRITIGNMLLQYSKPMLFKALDAIWKEKMEKIRSTATVSAGQKRKREKESKRSVSVASTAPTSPAVTAAKPGSSQGGVPKAAGDGPAEEVKGEKNQQPSVEDEQMAAEVQVKEEDEDMSASQQQEAEREGVAGPDPSDIASGAQLKEEQEATPPSGTGAADPQMGAEAS